MTDKELKDLILYTANHCKQKGTEVDAADILDTWRQADYIDDDDIMEDYMIKESLEHYREQAEGYKKIFNFLTEECVYNKDRIIEVIGDCETIKVFGIVKGEWVVKDNELYVVAEVPDTVGFNGNEKVKLTHKWQSTDNYAVYQRTEFEDSYYGYLLIPAYNNKEFLCVYYYC